MSPKKAVKKKNQSSKRKTWKEKMNPDTKYEVKITVKDFADIPAGSKMLIATPKIVDDYVRQIPAGSESSVQIMRKDLAAEYRADYACPVTSGIFLRIVAEAALEDLNSGKLQKSITPFWRMGDSKSTLAKKVSCGPDFIKKMRKKEGLEP